MVIVVGDRGSGVVVMRRCSNVGDGGRVKGGSNGGNRCLFFFVFFFTSSPFSP